MIASRALVLAVAATLALAFATPSRASALGGLPLCETAVSRATSDGTARFVLSSGEGRRVVEYKAGVNLIFCRQTTATMIWIRFAESSVDDGERGPHLDVDLCNATATGSLRPMVARAQPCPGGATWALWWHDGSGGTFANGPASSLCEMSLEVVEDGLRGRFSCLSLVDDKGGETLDVLEGSFECVWDSPAKLGGGERPW